MKAFLGVTTSRYGPKFRFRFSERPSQEVINALQALDFAKTHRTFNTEKRTWFVDLLAFPEVLSSIFLPYKIELDNDELAQVANACVQTQKDENQKPDIQVMIEGSWTNIREVRVKIPIGLDDELSYFLEGYDRTNAFKKGKWDGKRHLLRKRGRSDYKLRTGLWPRVRMILQAYSLKLDIVDNREIRQLPARFEIYPTELIRNLGILDLWPHQQETVLQCLTNKNGIVEIAMGGGKCLKGDSYVFTGVGMRQLKEIYASQDPFKKQEDESTIPCKEIIETFDFKEFNIAYTSHLYQKKKESIKEIKTQLGLSLGATPEHRIIILSEDGDLIWRRMDELKVGDMAVIRVGTSLFNGDTNLKSPMKLGYLLGLLVGDGGLTIKNRITFTNNNKVLLNSYKSCLWDLYGLRGKVRDRGRRTEDVIITSSRLKNNLKYLGLKPVYSYQKEVPWSILEGTEEIQSGFLRGLFDTDGSIESGERSRVTYSTSSPQLAHQVQLMLLNFGIVTRLRVKKTKKRDHYILTIYNDFLQIFKDKIGFNHPKKRIELLKGLKVERNTNVNLVYHIKMKIKRLWQQIPLRIRVKHGLTGCRDGKLNGASWGVIRSYWEQASVPVEKLTSFLDGISTIYPSITGTKEYQNLLLLTNGLFFTQIVHIKDSIDAVMDFTVPDTHSFIANGFINHNTVTMAMLIALIRQPTNIFIHRLEIASQLLRIFRQAFGDDNVGFIGDQRCEPVLGGVNVILLPTARIALEALDHIERWKKNDAGKWEKVVSKIKMDPERYPIICETIFGANASFYDEGHHLGAETYAQVSACTRSNYNLCFSATPWRNDGADLELEAGAGPKIVQYGLDELVESGFLMAPRVEIHDNSVLPMKNRDWRGDYKHGIVQAVERNVKIVDKAQELVDSGRTGLIAVTRLAHGQQLTKMLEELGVSCKWLHGKHDTKVRDRSLRKISEGDLDVIVSTLFGEGTDVPSWGFLIRAKAMGAFGASGLPNTDIYQIAGRVLRTHPDKLQPVIVDFFDRGNSRLEAWAKDRVQAYKHYKSFQVHFYDVDGKEYGKKPEWVQNNDTPKIPQPIESKSEKELELGYT